MSQLAISPEIELILKSLRWIVSGAPRTERFGLSLPNLSGLNWREIARIGPTHRVFGFIASALEQNGIFIFLAPEVQALLIKGILEAEWQNRTKLNEFKNVTHLFAEKNIPIIPLKGIDLSLRVYRDMPFRQMGDLDVLVREKDLTRASQCLMDHGFHLKKFHTKNRWQDSLRLDLNRPLEKHSSGRASFEKNGLDLDLHWQPRHQIGSNLVEMDLDQAWADSKPCPALGENVRVLSDDDAACHLALHTAEMFNPSLIQLLDLALLMNHYENETAETILRRLPKLADLSRKKINTLFEDVQKTFKAGRTVERLLKFFIFGKTSEFYEKEWVPETDLSRRLRSPMNRLLYFLGYFFPNPDYYRGQKGLHKYLTHWKELGEKLGKSILGKIRT